MTTYAERTLPWEKKCYLVLVNWPHIQGTSYLGEIYINICVHCYAFISQLSHSCINYLICYMYIHSSRQTTWRHLSVLSIGMYMYLVVLKFVFFCNFSVSSEVDLQVKSLIRCVSFLCKLYKSGDGNNMTDSYASFDLPSPNSAKTAAVFQVRNYQIL